MPVYVYECCDCKHRFDEKSTMTDRNSVTHLCPSCGYTVATRVLGASPPTVLYKGDGWAKKDRHASRD